MTTQFARASYQEIIDLHTEEDTVSVIGIHTPQGDTPRKMFGGFFDQFKKFKYLGCSVSLVPAARLPADPSQVSYEAGEQYIDPRDMLNPLMFHGCHGNDMGVILNRFYNTNSIADSPQTDSTFFYSDSVTDITDGNHISGLQLEDLYYKALTDNTWKKAHPQRGFKKGGLRPLVYSMATNMQFSGGDSIGMDGFGIPEDTVDDVSASGQSITATFPVSQNGRRFFTPRLTGLGWLDTRNVLTTATTVTGTTADIRAMLGSAALAQQDASEADLPLVYMGMILLPPAYKTEQYFRMIVNHHFAFKDFRGISFSNNLVEPPAYNQLNVPDDRYYPGEGGSVDPPTPDPPTPDPPTPPIGDVPMLSAYSSALQVGNDMFDSWGIFEYEGEDYSVIDTSGTITYTKFITKRDGASSTDLASDMVGIGGWDNSNVIINGANVNGSTTKLWGVFKYGGVMYAYVGESGSRSWVVVTSDPAGHVEGTLNRFTLSPADASVSAVLGTTTEFEGLVVVVD